MTVASSAALVGLADFVFHVFGALVVIRQLRRHPGSDQERPSLRLIAMSLFALAAYVTADSIGALMAGRRAAAGMPALAYLIAMLALGSAKRRVGRDMGSRTLVADSTRTLLCACLSGAASVGWWQVGPIAGLSIAWLAVRKGREAWQSDPEVAAPARSSELSWDGADGPPGRVGAPGR